MCEECGAELQETRFRDNTIWTPAQLAGYGRRKHNRVLCMNHYRAANDARNRAENGAEVAPEPNLMALRRRWKDLTTQAAPFGIEYISPTKDTPPDQIAKLCDALSLAITEAAARA